MGINFSKERERQKILNGIIKLNFLTKKKSKTFSIKAMTQKYDIYVHFKAIKLMKKKWKFLSYPHHHHLDFFPHHNDNNNFFLFTVFIELKYSTFSRWLCTSDDDDKNDDGVEWQYHVVSMVTRTEDFFF